MDEIKEVKWEGSYCPLESGFDGKYKLNWSKRPNSEKRSEELE